MATDTRTTFQVKIEETEERRREEVSFIVVEFKRAINHYYRRVCVPRTWITCPMRGLKVAIGYPAEEEDTIAQRVRNKEPVNKNWQTYIGEIKYETDQQAVGHLLTICGRNSEQVEDYNSQKPIVDAVDDLTTVCEVKSEQIEDNSNEEPCEDDMDDLPRVYLENSKQIDDNRNKKPNEDAVAYLQTICAGTSEQIEDNNNENPNEIAVGCVKIICEGNSEQIEDNSNKKPNEDDGLSKICTGTSEQIEDNSNKIEVITEPEHPLKLRMFKQLSLTDNRSERSSSNSSDSRVGTESYMSGQSNCKSSESSPKSQESESINSVNSAPETHLIKNKYKHDNNYYSYSLKRKIESVDADKDINNDMFFEDQQLVENMYMNIMRQLQYLETAALEIKKCHLIAMENKKALDKLAAKYRIPLHVTEYIEREKERKRDPVEEEILQDDEMEIQDDVAQVAEESKNTSEENLLQEGAERLQGSKSDSQVFTDDESTQDHLPPSQEVIKYKRKTKEIDIRTLKHPRPGKGLIQIGGNSRIFISAKGLVKAKRTSNDVLQFARALFREVFIINALRTHSMTGFIRPALPFEVTKTLKDYAKKYGETVGWVSVNSQKLEHNLNRMMHYSRRYRRK